MLFKHILSSLVILSCSIEPTLAHTIKTDSDVGATFHLEPNHNPRAGESSRVWFALTRRGGQSIPLSQCNCQLKVSPQSSAQKAKVINPPLKAISAEKYQGIPGADLVFPSAGIYELEISGTPKAGSQFQPFKLTYTVTVAPSR
ncbi:MAG: hypothetical protein ACRC2R_18925 [Xenococcaceae cyanobacterium]